MTDIIFAVIIVLLCIWHAYDVRKLQQQHGGDVENNRLDYLELLKAQRIESEATVDHLEDIMKDLTKERSGEVANTSKLINAVIAKNANEVRDLNLTDKVSIANQPANTPDSDLVPVADLSQSEWEEHVLGKPTEVLEEAEE